VDKLLNLLQGNIPQKKTDMYVQAIQHLICNSSADLKETGFFKHSFISLLNIRMDMVLHSIIFHAFSVA
jgi:hypothetical protein